MRTFIFQLGFFLKTLAGLGQELPPEPIAALPQILNENSGMVVLSADSILLINDSGNPPYIYLIDSTGIILKETFVQNFPNHDWEELTSDGQDNLFVGDFGNNANERQNLAIATFSINQILSKDSVQPLYVSNISYANQKNFPPATGQQYFDMEAMIFFNDSLHLFSKNRTDPFDGKVYQYSLPAVAGTFNLTPADSFVSGLGARSSYWITASAFNKRTSTLALIGYDKMWLFKNVTGSNFFTTTPTVFAFNSFSQKESVDFVNDSVLYLSDEKSLVGNPTLYKVSLKKTNVNLVENMQKAELNIINTLVKDTVFLNLKGQSKVHLVYEIFTVEGKRPLFGKLGNFEPGEYKLTIDASVLPPGSYVINVLIDGEPNAFRFSKRYQFKN